MDYMEIEDLARKLSPQERIRLAESLLRSLRVKDKPPVSKKIPAGKLTAAKQSSLHSVLGVLRVEGASTPTDNQIKNMTVDYLMEKYS
ncbi:MAG: hypothetical protein Fur002_06430 [Anaerolineales bacterium]